MTASTLARGHAGLADFSDEALSDPDVRPLAAKTAVRLDPAFETRYPREWPSRLRVRLEDGNELTFETSRPRGDPESPLERDDLESKFRDLVAYGGGEVAADGLLDWVSGLREGKSVSLPRPPA